MFHPIYADLQTETDTTALIHRHVIDRETALALVPVPRVLTSVPPQNDHTPIPEAIPSYNIYGLR